ncbi:ABC transporter permease [Deltaproteobacteria bacterium OttesenSCG-928-K17]|nr:ABC transporter permease [Deltaproteobacteria bacterium OttesenSCG-928-K17]
MKGLKAQPRTGASTRAAGNGFDGLQALIRKELADHFSAGRFILLAALIFMAALISAFMAGQGLSNWLADGLGRFLDGRLLLFLFASPASSLPVFAVVAYLGPLWGLLLGFDAINRERGQGTLSKILAQPIYRYQVILGKYLAGLFTVALFTAALILVLSGLGLAVFGLTPTGAEAARLLVFWLVSVIYIGFWLAAGLLMSALFKAPATSALASAALWLFLAFFTNVLAGGAAGLIAPVSNPASPAYAELKTNGDLYRSFKLISPVAVYDEAAAFTLDPGRRDLNHGRQLLDRAAGGYGGRFNNPLPFTQALILALPHLAGLLAWTALAFILSLAVFTRQEIRSSG